MYKVNLRFKLLLLFFIIIIQLIFSPFNQYIMFLICNSIPGIENNNKVIFSYKITKYLKKKKKKSKIISLTIGFSL